MLREDNTFNLPLQDDLLTLKRFQLADIEDLQSFFYDEDNLYYYLIDPPKFNSDDPKDLCVYLQDWNNGQDCFLWTISDKQTAEIIGLINLEDYSINQSHSEIGIVITNIKYRRSGYARRAIKLILAELESRQFKRVYCRIIEGNNASLKLFESLGFKLEGVWHKHVKRDGKFLNLNCLAKIFD